jgi:hypothetical protein
MPSDSFAFAQPLFYGIRGCQEALSGFLKTLINHFRQGIVFWGEREKKVFQNNAFRLWSDG